MTRSGSVGDDVLRWASENGAGRWAELREAIAHASALQGRRDVRSWFLASDLSDLGHLDVDWEQGTWSVAAPCVVVSPGMGLCAYIAGWRNSSLRERFDAAADDLDIYPFEVDQWHAPKALFAKSSSLEGIEALAARMGVPVVFDPCAQLTSLIQLAEEPRQFGAPPPPGEELARFSPRTLAWVDVAEPDQPGLYRFELHGRKTFRLFEEDWFIVGRSVGQLRVLAGRDDIIRWHPASRDGRRARACTVPEAVSLPPIAARAAVSAAGVLPRRIGGRRAYLNVPRAVAADIAERLGLTLSVAAEPVPMEG